MTVADIVSIVAVAVLIGVLYAIVQAERKRGAPLCGRACGGCPHPCRSDGTPRESAPAMPSQAERQPPTLVPEKHESDAT